MSRIAPSFPATQNTPNTTTVTTATGFSQGDLVYYNGGDYKPPSALPVPSLVNFNVPQQQTIMSAGLGGYGTPVFNNAAMQTANNYGSSSGDKFAILTNGNIVQVFRTTNNYYPAFRIVSPAGAIVVATTNISTAAPFPNSGSCAVSVCALSGGGFAVAFTTSSSNPAIAVYTNAGVVTTAAASDPIPVGTIAGYSNVVIAALPNGGFVVAAANTTPTLYFKIYTSTGGTTTTWTAVSIAPLDGFHQFAIAARSDSSFCIAFHGGSSYLSYGVYNSTGGVIVAANQLSSSYLTSFVDVACLSDGTTFVLGWNRGANGASCNLLPTGNVLGSIITLVPYLNTYSQGHSSTALLGIKIVPQAAGGFACITTDYSGATYAGFYNSSGAYLGTTNANGNIPIVNPAGGGFYYTSDNSVACKIAAYELSGKIYFSFPESKFNALSNNMLVQSIDPTTFQFVLPSTTTSLSNISGNYIQQAPSSLSLTNSTPTGLKYLASSTASYIYNQNVSTPVAPSAFSSIYPQNMHCCTLTDGSIAVTYVNNASPYSVYVHIFSPYGVQLQSFIAGYSAASMGTHASKVFALASGKFGVAYVTSASAMTINIYSASYSQTSTVNLTGFSSLTINNIGFDIAGSAITDRFAIFSTSIFYIYDNTGTLFAAPSVTPTTSSGGFKVAADSVGGYYIAWCYSGGAQDYVGRVSQTGSATYTFVFSYTSLPSQAGTTTDSSFKICSSNSGNVVMPYSDATTTNFNTFCLTDYPSDGSTSQYNQFIGSLSCTSGSQNNACSVTGNGAYVVAMPSAGGSVVTLKLVSGPPLFYAQAYSSFTQVNSYPYRATISTTISFGGRMSMTSGPGNSVFLCWMDFSNQPSFAIFNIMPIPLAVNLTSGSTLSLPVPVNASTSSSLSIQNTILSGVAGSTASAGSSAPIITNGQAVLNSNYSASTPVQSFDYQLPNGTGIQGVKGTISGRNVTLFGNN